MGRINALLSTIRAFVARLLHGDLQRVLALFDTAADRADKFIKVAEADLKATKERIDVLGHYLTAKNAEVDQAYAALHHATQAPNAFGDIK